MENRELSGFLLGRSLRDASRQTIVYTAILAPPTLLYLALAVPFMWNNQPVSRFIGLPKNDASALLLDMCCAALPIVGLISVYLVSLKRKRVLIRKKFIADMEGHDLVRAKMNPSTIYQVISRRSDGGIGEMQVVWTPDGRCANGTVYADVDAAGISQFNAARFLDG